jgi:2-aminoethylphosphonate-pyruvate transaminase
MVTGSGTAGNETILSSIGNKKKILVLSNGEFGNRLIDIAKIHHKNVKSLSFDWGKPMIIKKIETLAKKYSVDVIVMVHHETSSGILNPIKAVGDLAHSMGAMFIVDAVSSAAAEKIEIEKSHITFLNTASGKAFGSFPGIAVVVGKRESFEALIEHAPKTAYLNLYKFYHYATTRKQTPNTPGVQLFSALDQAVQNIIDFGVKERRAHIYNLATYMRAQMKEMGFTFLLDENMSSAVTSVYLPKGLTFARLQREMRKRNIIIYSGKGPLEGLTFQIGHMGELTMKDAKYFIKSLKKIVAQPAKKRAYKKSYFKIPNFGFAKVSAQLAKFSIK